MCPSPNAVDFPEIQLLTYWCSLLDQQTPVLKILKTSSNLLSEQTNFEDERKAAELTLRLSSFHRASMQTTNDTRDAHPYTDHNKPVYACDRVPALRSQ